MKILGLAIICLLVFACAQEKERTISPQTVKAQGGGVDVGNMSSTAEIPSTHASITFPTNWNANLDNNSLTLTNAGSSTIKAFRSKIDLVAPTQIALVNYLKVKYPDRVYEMIELNGLKGVRTEINVSLAEKIIDMYLVSELHDFIQIESSLNNADNGLTEGEQIISTTRIKFRGEAIKNPVTKTISYTAKDYSFSFSGDCFKSESEGCNGVKIRPNKSWLYIEKEKGRIIDLGPAKEVPFDSVRIEGEYLISPQTKVPIKDIYSTFTPKVLTAEQNMIKAKVGHTYLIRTKDWPLEDIITKMSVKILKDDLLTVTYQKLIYVPSSTLAEQVDIVNKNTIENEMPLDNGEVTLFDENLFKNASYSSFNFKYSNSGNNFLVKDNWDFTFFKSVEDGDGNIKVDFTKDDSLTGIVPFGCKKLSSITISDFPENSQIKQFELMAGRTYGIFNHRIGTKGKLVYGAVQVLEVSKDSSWVRLKFRRILVSENEVVSESNKSPLSYYEGFTLNDLNCEIEPKPKTPVKTNEEPKEVSKLSDDKTHFPEPGEGPITLTNDKNTFRPFDMGDTRISFVNSDTGDKLVINDIDGRTINLGKDQTLYNLDSQDIHNSTYFKNPSIAFSKGDILVMYKPSFEKGHIVIQIDDHVPGKSVKISHLIYVSND